MAEPTDDAGAGVVLWEDGELAAHEVLDDDSDGARASMGTKVTDGEAPGLPVACTAGGMVTEAGTLTTLEPRVVGSPATSSSVAK